MDGMRTKTSVRLDPRTIARPEFWRMSKAVQATAPTNYYSTITSGCDSKHKTDSKHYLGWAKDYRIKDVPGVKFEKLSNKWICTMGREILEAWAERIRKRLGSQYFVSIEYHKVHLHIQYNGG